MREQINRDYNITIPRWVAYRPKKMAMKKVYGNEIKHYKTLGTMLRQYKKWNLDSMCGLVKHRPNFHRMFVCLDAYKKCLIVKFRPIITLDGCYLKGSYEGQLLSCVIGRDGNDDLFPNYI